MCFVLGALVFIKTHENPIVVVLNDKESSFYSGERKRVEINKKNIENFILEYVKLRYIFRNLNPKTISQNIIHITTKGFREKTFYFLKNLKRKKLKGKKVSQNISNIIINVSKNETIASFDKILRINNIPLVIPVKIKIHLLRDTKTKLNPIGILINGETIYEN